MKSGWNLIISVKHNAADTIMYGAYDSVHDIKYVARTCRLNYPRKAQVEHSIR